MDHVWLCLNMGSTYKAWDQSFDEGIMVYTTTMGKPVVYPQLWQFSKEHRFGNEGDFPLTRDTGNLLDTAVSAGCICRKVARGSSPIRLHGPKDV